MPRESAFVAVAKKYLRSRGAWPHKAHGGPYGAVTGTPDLLVCYRGRFVAVECKAPSGFATALQERTLTDIRRAGGLAEVARSLDDIAAVLDKVDKDE